MIFDDLSVFIHSPEFSIIALIGGRQISGIFDEESTPMFDSDIAEGRRITFCLETAVAKTLDFNQLLSIGTKSFKIVNSELYSDGKLIDLVLKEI